MHFIKSSFLLKSMCYTMPMVAKKKTTKKNNHKFTPFVWFFIFLLIALGFAAILNKALLAASVNGQPINRLDIVRELEKQGGQQALESLISKKLITQAITNSDEAKVSEKELNQRMKEIEQQLKQQDNDLESLLAMQGMTKEEFIEQIKIRMFLEKVLKNKIKVAKQEVADYLEQNQALMPEGLSQAEQEQLAQEQLENQKLNQQTQLYLQNLKDNAKIIYFVKY